MKDFEFSLPTQIVFGRGAEGRVGELAAGRGTSALLLYGSPRVKNSGLLGCVASSLEDRGIAVTEFGGIVENPTLEKAEEGCRLVREKKIDLLLAIGGGSVIDTAKAIAVGAPFDGPLWDLYETPDLAKSALPLGVVLTLAATASEANCVTVLHNTQINEKRAMTSPLVCPQFALMNPELTFSVPPYQTAAGSVDIFSHAFERYFHKEQSGTLRDQLCESVMRTVIAELPRALAHPRDYDARSQLMWTATVAHSNMIGLEGDFACHALSHVLTGELGISHGAALGILMVAWCKFMLAGEAEAIARFAHRVWQVPVAPMAVQTAQNGISEFQNFLCSVGLPVTLREAGFPDVDVADLARRAVPSPDGVVGTGAFQYLSLQDGISVLQLAMG